MRDVGVESALLVSCAARKTQSVGQLLDLGQRCK